MPKISIPLNCTIDRLENSKAILQIIISGDKQELIIPKRFLPERIKEGDILQIEFATQKTATITQKKLAQNILSEILNIDDK